MRMLSLRCFFWGVFFMGAFLCQFCEHLFWVFSGLFGFEFACLLYVSALFPLLLRVCFLLRLNDVPDFYNLK